MCKNKFCVKVAGYTEESVLENSLNGWIRYASGNPVFCVVWQGKAIETWFCV